MAVNTERHNKLHKQYLMLPTRTSSFNNTVNTKNSAWEPLKFGGVGCVEAEPALVISERNSGAV